MKYEKSVKVNMETKLKRIAELSAGDPKMKFNGLMTYFRKEYLEECFNKLDGRKAVGVDGQTKEMYEEDLSGNLSRLISRMKTMSYRPGPVREVLIPKANGKMRPLGIGNVEDKVVQMMMGKILEAI